MKILQDRILKDGKVLPGNIIKVDGFLNHRVDISLLKDIADEFYRLFADKKPTMILTVEASGIALAAVTAERFGIPMREEDRTEWDLGRTYRIDPEEFLSLGRATPFAGTEVYGRCLRTVHGGRTVYEERTEEK